MYLQHFGLSDRPFRIVPSQRYFFVSETHDEGRARILYGIRENRGFIVATGDVGLGKTTVLLSVVSELESEMDVAIIVNPIDSFDQLLHMICEELGVSVRDTDEATLMAHLNAALMASYAKGRGCVLMLDEAQNLSIEVLEKVRTLSNLQTEDASLLQIVLVGQPELTAKLNDHRLRQLRQRIGVWHEILPLEPDDTADYLLHRLALSGAPDPRAIAKPRSCKLIHEYTHGIPRLINQIADTALVVAYGQGSRSIEIAHVHEAAAELRLEEEFEDGPVNAPRRARTARSARTGSRKVPRWLVAVLLGIVVVLVAGAAWQQFGDQIDLTTSEASDDAVLAGLASPPEQGRSEVAPVQEQPVVPVLDIDAQAFRAAYSQIEESRARGPVYGVHLASFRSLAGAQDYVDALMLEQGDWDEPLFVEQTADSPPWFQVIAGGYAHRRAAIKRVRQMKSELGLGYAQLTQLGPAAKPMLPSGLESMGVGDKDE